MGFVLSYIKYTIPSNRVQVESADNYRAVVLGLKTINLYSYTYDLTGALLRYLVVHGRTPVNSRVAGNDDTILGYTRAQWKAMPSDKVISLLTVQ